MMQYFEWNLPNDGNLWRQLKKDARHLHHIGVSAVWIPPAYKALDQKNQGYAAYDLYDLGEFDQKGTTRTKYGTKAELLAAIRELHKYNISVYLDAVLNHKIGADNQESFLAVEVDPSNRLKEISSPKAIKAWTKFRFPGREGAYSSFVWQSHHFTGVEMPDSSQKRHIYRICGQNKHWSEDVDEENGNFDFLMGTDIDHNHPEVVADLNQWGRWVAEELSLDGMRLDAIKHISRHFIHQFVDTLRENNGSRFYFVGEYWKAELPVLKQYLSDLEDSIDLFDVPLHYNFYTASQIRNKYDLRTILNNSLVAASPTSAVTFVDNHDSQRGSALESEVADWFKPMAYAFILLRKEGYPCLFYGDYYGKANLPSPHKLILEKLLHARRAFAYGEEIFYAQASNMIGFVRLGDDQHPASGIAVVISNKGRADCMSMNVGADKSGQFWKDTTGSIKKLVRIEPDGNGIFPVTGCGLSVWVRAESRDLLLIKAKGAVSRLKLHRKRKIFI